MTGALDLFAQLEEMILSQRNSPLEQEEVDIIVALGEEVSQDTSGITTADLIGWQREVDALDEVPHLSDHVLAETPARGREARQFVKLKDEVVWFFFSFIGSTKILRYSIFLSFANKITWLQSEAELNTFP